MQFSERWLRSLVETDLGIEALGERLTLAGLELEAIAPVAPPFDQVVVAEIIAARRHPNADRLQLCTVRVGQGEALAIVCGAANARPGLKTACALVGARLPGGIEIRPVQVRGVDSHGMLCSARELGLAEAAEGILELPHDAPVGVDLRAYLHLDDRIVTLKLTPNRGDCLSLTGIAREVAALTGARLQAVDCSEVSAASPVRHPVDVLAAEACPRYCGRVIRGLDAAARTPAWMAERLARSGVRCIHPVVDVTNYVLLELGQPMHAFDLGRLAGPVRVRWAQAGERLHLLNGEEIALAPDCLIIADDGGPLALAGIMGGAGSAVGEGTRDVFLEAAHFTPAAVAGRARRYGLATDSSQRFERGVDPELPRRAMERATRLILELCGGEAGPVVEAGPGVGARPPIAFRPQRAERLLGISLPEAHMLALFGRLGLAVDTGATPWQVRVPSWRFDLVREVDLIEELARLHGYERIPPRAPSAVSHMLPAHESERPLDDLKAYLSAMGYHEVITYSFISSEQHNDFTNETEPIVLRNPIASSMNVMRASLLPGLVHTLRHNLNHGQERVRLFELGRCFLGTDAAGQPLRLGGLAHGAAMPEQWGMSARTVDFYDVKAELEALFWPQRPEFVPAAHPALHPGRCARLRLHGVEVGWLGSLHPRLTQKYDLGTSPVVFELQAQALIQRPLPRYAGLSRFPAVRRDLAVVVAADLPVGPILAAVRAALPALVTEFELFDVYQGQAVEPGKKSLAFRMLLQHTEKTLTDTEIDAAVAQVLDFLTRHFDARLRT
ncbi:MAG: phenylalanine--tRNA ligase subunit beta [Thiobacillaceae bacterium]|nr:phenylalanine--tRNA ligase subunit beta [Thiobacillaceae bacterium]